MAADRFVAGSARAARPCTWQYRAISLVHGAHIFATIGLIIAWHRPELPELPGRTAERLAPVVRENPYATNSTLPAAWASRA
jgi:hypothetical protein